MPGFDIGRAVLSVVAWLLILPGVVLTGAALLCAWPVLTGQSDGLAGIALLGLPVDAVLIVVGLLIRKAAKRL
jgi:hypothetical protein